MKAKAGQKVVAYISYANEYIKATVIGIGEHKGKKVYDLDNNRFIYESQIIQVKNH